MAPGRVGLRELWHLEQRAEAALQVHRIDIEVGPRLTQNFKSTGAVRWADDRAERHASARAKRVVIESTPKSGYVSRHDFKETSARLTEEEVGKSRAMHSDDVARFAQHFAKPRSLYWINLFEAQVGHSLIDRLNVRRFALPFATQVEPAPIGVS